MKRLIATISLVAIGLQTAVTSEKVEADLLFVRKVLPLFKSKCLPCHGKDPKKKLKGEFDMRSSKAVKARIPRSSSVSHFKVRCI